MNRFYSALFFLLLAAATGCHSLRKPGFPQQSYDEGKLIRQLETNFPPTLVNDYYAATNETSRRVLRDKIIDGRIALIDLHYNQFVAQFSVTRQSFDAASEVTELGLNLATTAVGGAAAKTVLGAVSAGVSGSQLAVDKNFFYEKTVPVLVGSMNAQRKVALVPILSGQKKNTQDYPLTQALSDMDSYYFAGTFVGALQAVQADSGAKEKSAQEEIDSIRFAEDDSSKTIRAWLWPNGVTQAYNTNNLAALRAWQKNHQLNNVLLERFLEEKTYATNRTQAINDLKISAQ